MAQFADGVWSVVCGVVLVGWVFVLLESLGCMGLLWVLFFFDRDETVFMLFWCIRILWVCGCFYGGLLKNEGLSLEMGGSENYGLMKTYMDCFRLTIEIGS